MWRPLELMAVDDMIIKRKPEGAGSGTGGGKRHMFYDISSFAGEQ